VSALSAQTRAAALRVLVARGATDLIPILGLDQPRRGRPRRSPPELGGRCEVDGCDRPPKTRGMCGSHYISRRWRPEALAAGRLTHGTTTAYAAGCRCASCRRVQADYWQVRRAREVARS
jgi:hypothetical protein